MKRICFLNSTLDIGGSEKMRYEIIKNLDKKRFQASAYCLYRPGAIGYNLMLEGVSVKSRVMKNRSDLIGAFKLIGLFRKDKIEVLYMESSPVTLFFGFIFGKLAGIRRFVTVIHDLQSPESFKGMLCRMAERLILPRLDEIGVVSKVRLDSLLGQYPLDPDKVRLIYNGIDIEKFDIDACKANEIRKRMNIDKDEIVIGMVGRLAKEKAYDVFIKAAALVNENISRCRFIIVGGGKEKDGLVLSAGKLGIIEKVIFTGERHDIPELISIFDVAVLSSRVESSPVVLLEYMAGAKPIVATDAGGNREIITHNKTGVIVPSESYEDLAYSILELARDRKKADMLSEAARAEVRSRFSMENMVKDMEMLLGADRKDDLSRRTGVMMVGPELGIKGGISSFASYCLSSELADRFMIIYHPTATEGTKIKKILFFIKSTGLFILRMFLRRDIRIIQISSASNSSFYRKSMIAMLGKIFRKSVIIRIEGGAFEEFYLKGNRLKRFYIRRILNIADAIFVLSYKWSAVIQSMTDNPNIKVIPNSIDNMVFKPAAAERKEDSFNVISIGRLEKDKGIYDILESIPEIVKHIPAVKFYFAGGGEIENVERICRERGIQENVVLLGWLGRDELLEALNRSNLFLLPSYYEGMPISMLEAMACGLPVISSNVGGIPEIIENGINGFLVNPGDKEGMRQRILDLFMDEKLRLKISENNVKKIESMYSMNAAVGRFSEEYMKFKKGG